MCGGRGAREDEVDEWREAKGGRRNEARSRRMGRGKARMGRNKRERNAPNVLAVRSHIYASHPHRSAPLPSFSSSALSWELELGCGFEEMCVARDGEDLHAHFAPDSPLAPITYNPHAHLGSGLDSAHDEDPHAALATYVRHGMVSGIGAVLLRALRAGLPVWERGGDVRLLGGEFVFEAGRPTTANSTPTLGGNSASNEDREAQRLVRAVSGSRASRSVSGSTSLERSTSTSAVSGSHSRASAPPRRLPSHAQGCGGSSSSKLRVDLVHLVVVLPPLRERAGVAETLAGAAPLERTAVPRWASTPPAAGGMFSARAAGNIFTRFAGAAWGTNENERVGVGESRRCAQLLGLAKRSRVRMSESMTNSGERPLWTQKKRMESGGEGEGEKSGGEEADELVGDDDVGPGGGIGVNLGMYGGQSGVRLGMAGAWAWAGAWAVLVWERRAGICGRGSRRADVRGGGVGDVQEVHGDKEGLIMRSGAPSGGDNSPFYPGPGGGNGPYNRNHSPTETTLLHSFPEEWDHCVPQISAVPSVAQTLLYAAVGLAELEPERGWGQGRPEGAPPPHPVASIKPPPSSVNFFTSSIRRVPHARTTLDVVFHTNKHYGSLAPSTPSSQTKSSRNTPPCKDVPYVREGDGWVYHCVEIVQRGRMHREVIAKVGETCRLGGRCGEYKRCEKGGGLTFGFGHSTSKDASSQRFVPRATGAHGLQSAARAVAGTDIERIVRCCLKNIGEGDAPQLIFPPQKC
ncbi:hypothetical protein B0H14DRAFT_3752399 [Mycena olivaceomarginata]|nr:hypothetical protein B0H14DRAFT_3752399 [Mycena olivaceomarginata]